MSSDNKEYIKFFYDLDNINNNPFYYAFLYYEYNKDKWIYNNINGWYGYNEYNILINYKKVPPTLNYDITECLLEILGQKLIKCDLSELKEEKKNYILKSYYSGCKKIKSAKTNKDIIEYLKKPYNNNELLNKIDSNKNIICFKNQLYDIIKNEYRTIKRDDYCLLNTGYELPKEDDPEIQTELKELIKNIFDNDEKLFQFFINICSIPLISNCHEKLFILTGRGGNGKGLLSTLLLLAYGNYYYQTDNQFLTSKFRAGAGNSSLFNTKNKRFVMVSEPDNDNNEELKFNTNFIKTITGRDVITTREVGGVNESFIPSFSTFIQCNDKPRLVGIDNAIKRRFIVFNFPLQFVDNPKEPNERKIDYSLKDKLSNDKYYMQFMRIILNNINNIVYKLDENEINKIKNDILGKKKICYEEKQILINKTIEEEIKLNTLKNIKRIFDFKYLPQQIKNDTEAYFMENDTVGDFINSFLIITNDDKDIKSANELYRLYRENYPYLDDKTLKKEFLKKGLLLKKCSSMVYYRIKIKVEPEEEKKEENKKSLDL